MHPAEIIVDHIESGRFLEIFELLTEPERQHRQTTHESPKGQIVLLGVADANRPRIEVSNHDIPVHSCHLGSAISSRLFHNRPKVFDDHPVTHDVLERDVYRSKLCRKPVVADLKPDMLLSRLGSHDSARQFDHELLIDRGRSLA